MPEGEQAYSSLPFLPMGRDQDHAYAEIGDREAAVKMDYFRDAAVSNIQEAKRANSWFR
jgi:hypothetical protein